MKPDLLSPWLARFLDLAAGVLLLIAGMMFTTPMWPDAVVFIAGAVMMHFCAVGYRNRSDA